LTESTGRSTRRHFLTLGLLVASLANFATNAVIARFISKSAYGAVGSVLALATLLSIPITAIPSAVTRQVVVGAPGMYRLGRPLAWTVVAGVAVVCTAALLVPVLDPLLHLSGYWPILLLGTFLAALVIEIVPRGSLVGERRYVWVGVVLASGALIRVGTATGWVVLRPGPVGPLAAAAIAELVTASVFVIGMITITARGARDSSLQLRDVGLSIAGFTGLLSLMSIDTIAARHWLTGMGSGYYAAASSAGSIAYYMAANASAAIFPDVAQGASDRDSRSFWVGLVEISVLSLGSALVLILAAPLVIDILFGARYGPARAPLYALSLSYAFLGILAYLVSHQLAHRSLATLLPWAGTAALIVGVFVAHATPTEVAVDALIASGGLMVLLSGASLFLERRVAVQRRLSPR
jgi:O-antigen/teichoic acid export membrane protein